MPAVTATSKRVFVMPGRNVAARIAIERFVSALGLQALGFDEVAARMSNPMIARVAAARASASGEEVDPDHEHAMAGVGVTFVSKVVLEGLRRAQAALICFTPDELATLAPPLRLDTDHHDPKRWQSRPTVSFAAGIAIATAPERTLFVAVGTQVTIFPDVYAGDVLRATNDSAARSELRQRLIDVGLEVDRASDRWRDASKAGDFEACVAPIAALRPSDPFAPISRHEP